METFKRTDGIFEGIEVTGEIAMKIADYFAVEYLEESEVIATIERMTDGSVAQWCIEVDGYLYHDALTSEAFEESIQRFDF